MVPNGWKVITAKDIASNEKNAMSTGPFGSSISSKYFTKEGVPVIRGGNLSNKHQIQFIDEGFVYVSKEKSKEFTRSIVSAGDLIFTCWGTINQIGLIPEKSNYPYYIISNKQMKLSLNTNLAEPYYVYTLFSSHKIQHKIKAESIGSTIPGFNLGQLKAIKLLLPPFKEQQKIAKILTTWDKAINTTERLIENSKQQKKALMQQLLTGKKRLLDESGKRFEDEWRGGKLADFSKIKKGKALSKKNIIEGSYPVIAGGKSSPYSHNDFTHENVITVSASGAYAGYVAFFDYKIWASDCSVVEPKTNSDIKFLYYWLRSQQQRIYNLQSGGAQPHVYPKDLEGMKINLPPLEEQQKIAAVLTNASREIELLEQQLADLQQEKKALMQQLLTGKKRVLVD